MLSAQSEDKAVTSSRDFERFIRKVEKKDLLDIISFADQEATAAWRAAYHGAKSVRSGEPPGQYAGMLEELVAFLRAALVYRPAHIPKDVFHQFLQLRRRIAS